MILIHFKHLEYGLKGLLCSLFSNTGCDNAMENVTVFSAIAMDFIAANL